MSALYIPEHLHKWTCPRCYMGADWPDYYVFLGRNRDSDALDRANFDAALRAIGGEQQVEDETAEDGTLQTVIVVREGHFAVGWVEWIAIHETAGDALRKADEVMRKMESYPVVDEELWSQYEDEEANEVWTNCYNERERLQYIRDHRQQFEFRSFADLRQCVRGEFFGGYASELLS